MGLLLSRDHIGSSNCKSEPTVTTGTIERRQMLTLRNVGVIGDGSAACDVGGYCYELFPQGLETAFNDFIVIHFSSEKARLEKKEDNVMGGNIGDNGKGLEQQRDS